MANTPACTVSKILSGQAHASRISLEREAAVLQIAASQNYRPSAAARSMRLKRTGHVGLPIFNNPGKPLTNPTLYEIILGIDSTLSRKGYTCMLVRVSDVESMESESRVFREHILDGMIVMDHRTPEICERAERLVSTCIFAETSVWRAKNCIRRDEEWSGSHAAERLLECGYKQLLYFGILPSGEGQHFSISERYAGVQRTAQNAGIPLIACTHSRSSSADTALDALKAGMGVITYSSTQATALALGTHRKRLVPGRDFGLVSCDDTAELIWSWPTLSRVGFDRFDLGQQAAAMMLRRLEGRVKSVASRQRRGTWIEGDTLGHPAAAM